MGIGEAGDAESLCWPTPHELEPVSHLRGEHSDGAFRGTLGRSQQYAAITNRKVLTLGGS